MPLVFRVEWVLACASLRIADRGKKTDFTVNC